MKAPAAVGPLLADTFRDTPLAKRLAEAEIWIAWDRTVGPQIAAQARPSAMRDGVLTVMVASAPWMQQLTFLKGEIRERLNQQLGAELIRDIYLRAGKPSRQSPPNPLPEIPDRPLTTADLAAIANTVAGISDPDLQAACQRLLTSHHRHH